MEWWCFTVQWSVRQPRARNLELPGEEDVFQIINFCILYGKKYIFDCRINDNIVSIDRFESKLKNRLEVEIYIIDSCCIRLNTKKILLMELYNSLCS